MAVGVGDAVQHQIRRGADLQMRAFEDAFGGFVVDACWRVVARSGWRCARSAGRKAADHQCRQRDFENRRAHQWSLPKPIRSEEHTSELQSLMRISYAVFCLENKNQSNHTP